ncbi:hypothetical protein FSARC_5995 [Fusarium sarcochroum]|uniref:Tail specific protease domain-containing protein n=1 Tax=Fusarium sarcochroum TaxID=1208366 RepID=A0A8H4TYJ9_9HYPO|nr:hypothetical protein FSARC_5995 [Fusarium sarcochroum]
MLLLSLLALGLPLVGASSFTGPCAEITEAIKQHAKLNNTLSPLYVSAQIAEDCLQSMPFYPSDATKFIDELTKYVQWHSTLESLKNPPDTYKSPAVDIMGGLEKIRETKYSSQWEFDQAISALFGSANDGHLSATLCSFNKFAFTHGSQSLVSVSEDGLKTPELYTVSDSKYLNNNKSIKVSPIASIDGQDAESYLEKLSSTQSYQDPDARYNSVFYSPSRLAKGQPPDGGFLLGTVYSGKNITTIEHRNGSTTQVQNMARVLVTDFNATDGKEVYELYCRPQPVSDSTDINSSSESDTSGSSLESRSTSGPEGYPDATIWGPQYQINSYPLGDDTVVMLIPSFETKDDMPDNASLIFSNYATEIVETALKDGRDKIIIDISNNGGGTLSRAFDLFKLFFPDEFPYSATRFRRHEATETINKILSVANETEALNISQLAFSLQVTPDQQDDFESYQDFFGNKTELGTPLTSLHANGNYTSWSGANDAQPIRGYAGRPLNKKQPFKAENILIIGNGACSSTCTTFVNLMTNVGGVRTVSFGGRPNGKPMQIMGGVRGGQAMKFEVIRNLVERASDFYKEVSEKLDFISKSDIARLVKAVPIAMADFPIRIATGNVNFRNAYQEGDDDLPLQFQYQAADCRLYFTLENVLHPETIWKSAQQAIWGNGACINGSTGGLGSLEDREKKDKDKDDKNEEEEKGGSESGESSEKLDSGAHGLTVRWSMLAMVFAAMMVSL